MTVRLRFRGLDQLQTIARRIARWAELLLLAAGLVSLAFAALALADSAFSLGSVDHFQSTLDSKDDQNKRSDSSEHPALILGGRRLALLDIPRLNISAPLLNGTDWLTLNHGVGRITGTARPGEQGNIGIAGHRDTYFRELRNIKLGDVIELKRTDGIDTYKVDRLQIVMPSNVGVLRPTAVPTLTLVTCYPFQFVGSAPKRFVVTASLVTQAGLGEAATDVGHTTYLNKPNKLNKEKQ
jgi:LPXTG-site transpeptidase (sortase) family protein